MTEGGDDDSWDSTLVREPHIGMEFDGIGKDDDNGEMPSAAEDTIKLAMQMQRLCLSIFHHNLDMIGAIETLLKTWQRLKYV